MLRGWIFWLSQIDPFFRHGIVIELPCGDEGNFSDQVERKENEYNRKLISGSLVVTG